MIRNRTEINLVERNLILKVNNLDLSHKNYWSKSLLHFYLTICEEIRSAFSVVDSEFIICGFCMDNLAEITRDSTETNL